MVMLAGCLACMGIKAMKHVSPKQNLDTHYIKVLLQRLISSVKVLSSHCS